MLNRILSAIFRTLGAKGNTRPLQKSAGNKASFTKYLRERQRKTRKEK